MCWICSTALNRVRGVMYSQSLKSRNSSCCSGFNPVPRYQWWAPGVCVWLNRRSSPITEDTGSEIRTFFVLTAFYLLIFHKLRIQQHFQREGIDEFKQLFRKKLDVFLNRNHRPRGNPNVRLCRRTLISCASQLLLPCFVSHPQIRQANRRQKSKRQWSRST